MAGHLQTMPDDEPPPDHPIPAEPKPAGRRAFLRAAAWGGGFAGLGGLAGLAVSRIARRNPAAAGRATALGDEFSYDVARFQKSDPALMRCDEVARFPAGLARARNLAAAPDGSIIVCGDGGIRTFTADGDPASAIPLDGPVHSVAVRPSGGILAGLDGAIAVFAPPAAEPVAWNDFPNGLLPASIAVAGDETFVADARNRVVLRLDAAGKTLAVIGARDPARGIGGFVVPSPYFCVRLAPDGLLRVSNPGEHRIEAYTLDGGLELAWGKASFAVDGFCGCCNPVSFDIFPDGSFVTCEKGLPRVKLHDSHGEFTGLVAGPEAFPQYLQAANAGTPNSPGAGLYAAIDPQGCILVLDVIAGEERIMKMKELNG